MSWMIVAFLVSVVLFVIAGACFNEEKEPGLGFLPLIVGLAIGIPCTYNAILWKESCIGGFNDLDQDGIYKVVSQAKLTEGGCAVVLENGNLDVFCVETDNFIAPEVNYVRIGEQDIETGGTEYVFVPCDISLVESVEPTDHGGKREEVTEKTETEVTTTKTESQKGD